MSFRAAIVAVLFAVLLPATASAQLPGQPVSGLNVEFVKNFATQHDTAGAKLLGKYFYITTERDLTIYDVSAPENPVQVGHLDFPTEDLQNYYFTEEDPDTNGKILITSNEGAVEVIDVSDKTNPQFISKLAGESSHTITCVLDCTWAYGASGGGGKTGTIIDLRDPKNPKMAGNWVKQMPAAAQPSSNHDVTEVAPGIILAASQPLYLLDARIDPAHPTVLAKAGQPDGRFNHGTLWPNQMQDDLILVGGESVGPSCGSSESAAFQTYSAANWATTGTFSLLDEFRIPEGLLVDTHQVTSTYCTHWFSTHPTYRNGGMVAISWYEQGTRFLKVSRTGDIQEVGHYVPLGTTASAAYWVTDKIVYIADYTRGFDIVRYTGPITPGEPAPMAKKKKSKH